MQGLPKQKIVAGGCLGNICRVLSFSFVPPDLHMRGLSSNQGEPEEPGGTAAWEGQQSAGAAGASVDVMLLIYLHL